MKLILATEDGKLNRYYCIEVIIDRFRGSEVFNEARLRTNLKAMNEDDLFNMYHAGHGPSKGFGCEVRSRTAQKIAATLL